MAAATQPRLAEEPRLVPADSELDLTPNGFRAITTRSACSECQRRKQKCDRQYPCEQCRRRKVPKACRYKEDVVAEIQTSWTPSPDVRRRRDRRSDAATEVDMPITRLGAMGYTDEHVLAAVDETNEGGKEFQAQAAIPKQRQHMVKVEDSPALKRAVEVLPSRQLVDAMIQHFVQTVNFYYYAVYPDEFLREYNRWWRDYDRGLALPHEWTCLLIMACSCSVQHANSKFSRKLTADLGETPKALSEKYHHAARELYGAIPVRAQAEFPHLYTVQYLLHSCYWFKAEAMFEKCWNVLGSAVREAQMINLHRESANKGRTDFEKEMRRRLWCMIDAWDWLISILLARPLLVDRLDCDTRLPDLTLEPYPTSPMLHMKIQAQLVRSIWNRFGHPSNIATAKDVEDYKSILEAWMKNLPSAYRFGNPDIRQEKAHPWIELHRHYTHTVALSMALGPSRPFLAKTISRRSPASDLDARAEGVTCALRLMGAVHSFFDYVWNRDTTFHFVPFCIFDTAALLCACIRHDKDGDVPRRDEIFAAIDLALFTLRRLSSATETARNGSHLLRKMAAKLPEADVKLPHLNPALNGRSSHQRPGKKRTKSVGGSAFRPINGEGSAGEAGQSSNGKAEAESQSLPPSSSSQGDRLFYLEHPARSQINTNGDDWSTPLPYAISSTTGTVVTAEGKQVANGPIQPVSKPAPSYASVAASSVPLPSPASEDLQGPRSVLPNSRVSYQYGLTPSLPPQPVPRPVPQAAPQAAPQYIYASTEGETGALVVYTTTGEPGLPVTYTTGVEGGPAEGYVSTDFPPTYTPTTLAEGPHLVSYSQANPAAVQQQQQLQQANGEASLGDGRFGIISQEELGDLVHLWNWQELNLDLSLNANGTLNGL